MPIKHYGSLRLSKAWLDAPVGVRDAWEIILSVREQCSVTNTLTEKCGLVAHAGDLDTRNILCVSKQCDGHCGLGAHAGVQDAR
jgi:hypothetical protein